MTNSKFTNDLEIKTISIEFTEENMRNITIS